MDIVQDFDELFYGNDIRFRRGRKKLWIGTVWSVLYIAFDYLFYRYGHGKKERIFDWQGMFFLFFIGVNFTCRGSGDGHQEKMTGRVEQYTWSRKNVFDFIFISVENEFRQASYSFPIMTR